MLLGESTFSSYTDVCLKDKHISSCFFSNLSLSFSSYLELWVFSWNYLFFLLYHRFFPWWAYKHDMIHILFRKPPLVPLCPSIYCLPFLCTIPVTYFTVKLIERVVSLSLLPHLCSFGLPQVGFHPCAFTSLAVVNITSSFPVV